MQVTTLQIVYNGVYEHFFKVQLEFFYLKHDWKTFLIAYETLFYSVICDFMTCDGGDI